MVKVERGVATMGMHEVLRSILDVLIAKPNTGNLTPVFIPNICWCEIHTPVSPSPFWI